MLRGDTETGLKKLREGITQYRTSGAQFVLPYYLSLVADAYRQLEKRAEGLQVVAEALQLVETNLDIFWAAELHRLKGELTLQLFSAQRLASSVKKSPKSEVQGPRSKIRNPQSPISNLQSEAEACFHQAIQAARQQEAKLLELRAVISLTRLWRQQGKKVEAQQMLAELYDWFTEGFDAPDLQAAQALLTELT